MKQRYIVGYTRIVQVIVFQNWLGAQLAIRKAQCNVGKLFSQERCWSQLGLPCFETAQLSLFGNRAQEHTHMDIARTRNIYFITKPRNKQLIPQRPVTQEQSEVSKLDYVVSVRVCVCIVVSWSPGPAAERSEAAGAGPTNRTGCCGTALIKTISTQCKYFILLIFV